MECIKEDAFVWMLRQYTHKAKTFKQKHSQIKIHLTTSFRSDKKSEMVFCWQKESHQLNKECYSIFKTFPLGFSNVGPLCTTWASYYNSQIPR